MSLVIGIDPGKEGAWASSYRGHVKYSPLPSILALVDGLATFTTEVTKAHVFLEKAQARPGQGVVSMFTYGQGYGEIIGVLLALKIPHTLVPPGTWTRTMHAGTKANNSKMRSAEAVMRIFPELASDLEKETKKVRLGVNDALLIMEYGRRVLNGR